MSNEYDPQVHLRACKAIEAVLAEDPYQRPATVGRKAMALEPDISDYQWSIAIRVVALWSYDRIREEYDIKKRGPAVARIRLP